MMDYTLSLEIQMNKIEQVIIRSDAVQQVQVVDFEHLAVADLYL